jgi:hypothetical protein
MVHYKYIEDAERSGCGRVAALALVPVLQERAAFYRRSQRELTSTRKRQAGRAGREESAGSPQQPTAKIKKEKESGSVAALAPLDDICKVCKGDTRGELASTTLLCDECDAECHFKCATPVVTIAPPGSWYCEGCKAARLVRTTPNGGEF